MVGSVPQVSKVLRLTNLNLSSVSIYLHVLVQVYRLTIFVVVPTCDPDIRGHCASNARCIQADEGHYECLCEAGFYGNGFVSCEGNYKVILVLDDCITCSNRLHEGPTVADTDECASDEYTCTDNSECLNTIGSYDCQCQSGFMRVGDSCLGMKACSTRCLKIFLCTV